MENVSGTDENIIINNIKEEQWKHHIRLCALFDEIIKEENIPGKCKNTVPIFKQGDRKIPCNYR